MSIRNIIVSLRNTTGSTITLGTLSISAGNSATIWDTVNYTDVSDNFAQVLVGISTFNQNIGSGALVFVLNSADQSADNAFVQFHELQVAFQTTPGDVFAIIRLEHESAKGLADLILTDGSQGMAGDLNMDGYSVTNVNLVDGVNVTDHKSRHISGGADQLDGYQLALVYSPVNYNAPTSNVIGQHIAKIDAKLTAVGGGDVVGPASATDNAIARFDLATGKLIQNSLVLVTDAGIISNVTTPVAATDAATKGYVDGYFVSILSSATPGAVGTAGAAGTAITASRADHVHALTFATVNSIIGTANASISVNSQKITNLLTPTLATDAATKGYIDGYNFPVTAVTFANVNAALGTANASISVNSQKITNLLTPTLATDAATKGYVDGYFVSILSSTTPGAVGTAGAAGTAITASRADHVHALTFATVNSILGTANASISVNSQKITNLLTPTLATDAVTKGYVDGYFASNLSSATPGAVGTAGAAGTAITASRSDHVHALTFATVNSVIGTANASISVNSQKITNLLTPTLATDAATKGYIDGYAFPSGDFSNGGDTAGANRTLGNNDSYSLAFETNNTARLTITADGYVQAAGRLTSATYILGSDLSILPISSGQSAITSWWGLQLVGNKQASVNYTPVNVGVAGVAGVIIPVQQAAAIGLLMRGAAAQSGDLFVYQNNAGTELGSVDKDGYLRVGPHNAAFPTSPLFVSSDLGNTYSQIVTQNTNGGNAASTDFVATANNGTDSTFYVDLGINSSTYSEAAYNISGINDSYLFSIGGNLAIVAGTAAKTIKFATGGTTSAQLRMTLSDTALTMNSIQIKGVSTPTASTDAATKGYIDGYTFNASGLKSATTIVSVSAATAPVAGQVLTATSSTAATWQTPTGGGSTSMDGYVRAIASSTDNAIARWDSTTGKYIQDSIAFLDDSGYLVLSQYSTPFYNSPIFINNVAAASWLQVVIQNGNSSNNASSEFVATADTGTDTTNHVALGINSSTYNQAAYNIGAALDSYLYSHGGNLTVGTASASKTIKFHTGGTTTSQLRATISDTGLAMNSLKISGLSEPTVATDAATKNYVDTHSTGGVSLDGYAAKTYVDARLVQNFRASDFNDPGTDWAVTVPASLNADSVNAAVLVRRFDDTTEEGVGWSVHIPVGCTQVKFTFHSKAMTAPADTRTVGLALKKREVPNNSSLGAWASTTLTDLSFPTNVYFQTATQTITLSTLSLTADRFYQFELVRQNPSAGTELTGDWGLFMMVVEWMA